MNKLKQIKVDKGLTYRGLIILLVENGATPRGEESIRKYCREDSVLPEDIEQAIENIRG